MDSVQLGLIKVILLSEPNRVNYVKPTIYPWSAQVMSNHYQFCTNIFFLNAVFFSNIHLSPALEKCYPCC